MEEIKIGVVGLGYVGLPLARLFATKYAVVGFDLKKERIRSLEPRDRQDTGSVGRSDEIGIAPLRSQTGREGVVLFL